MTSRVLLLAISALMTLWSASVTAQCVTFDPVTVSQPYNPLSTSDFVAAFTGTARRSGLSLDPKFSALLLRRTGDSRPYQLFVISDDGSGGGTDLINAPPGPTVRAGLNDAGEIDLDFGTVYNRPVTRTFELQFRIPAGSDLPAGTINAQFDVKYLCEYLLLADQAGTQTQGFQLTFNVSSALQASLVGQDPDFGELGNLSTADVASAPLATTERVQYMRVASSGPFEVRVQSQNLWRMTATGGATGNAAERIDYRYTVLGQQLDNGRQTFKPMYCRASGTGGQVIPLTARVTEGGLGKIASPNYRDYVTITITPVAITQTGTVAC